MGQLGPNCSIFWGPKKVPCRPIFRGPKSDPVPFFGPKNRSSEIRFKGLQKTSFSMAYYERKRVPLKPGGKRLAAAGRFSGLRQIVH